MAEKMQEDNRDIFEKALDAGKVGLAGGAAAYLGTRLGGKAAKSLAKKITDEPFTKAELAEIDAMYGRVAKRAGFVSSAVGAGIGGSKIGAQRPKSPRK